MSDPVVAPLGCSPSDDQARIPLHESPVDEPHVHLGEIDVLSAGRLGDPPEPLQEQVLVVPQEPLGAEVLADLLRVSRLVLSSDLGEDRLRQALDHVLRSVPQIVRDLEADPLVGSRPLQLEVPEGGELRRDVLVSVPDACVAHGPVQHLAVAVFHFLLSPGPKCPEKGLADVRLRDRRASRTHSEREGADGPICARSVPDTGTGTGENNKISVCQIVQIGGLYHLIEETILCTDGVMVIDEPLILIVQFIYFIFIVLVSFDTIY